MVARGQMVTDQRRRWKGNGTTRRRRIECEWPETLRRDKMSRIE